MADGSKQDDLENRKVARQKFRRRLGEGREDDGRQQNEHNAEPDGVGS